MIPRCRASDSVVGSIRDSGTTKIVDVSKKAPHRTRRRSADRGGSEKFARHESGVGHTTTSLHARVRHRRSGGDDPLPPPFGEDLSGENTECRTRGRGWPHAWRGPSNRHDREAIAAARQVIPDCRDIDSPARPSAPEADAYPIEQLYVFGMGCPRGEMQHESGSARSRIISPLPAALRCAGKLFPLFPPPYGVRDGASVEIEEG